MGLQGGALGCGGLGPETGVRGPRQVPVPHSSWIPLPCGWQSLGSHLLLGCEGTG